MALIKCKNCGHMISDKANKCPKCGTPTYLEVAASPNDVVPLNEDEQHQPVYYEGEENDSHRWRYVVIAILLVAIAGGGYWAYDYNKHNKELEKLRIKQYNDSIAKAKADSIAEVARIEQARIDSINKERRENTYKAYIKILNDISKGRVYDSDYFDPADLNEYSHISCEYFLYDITKDEIPELWVKFGTWMQNTAIRVYSSQDGLCKLIYEDSAAHADFYEGKDYILEIWGFQGSADWSKLTYKDGKIVRGDAIFSEENVEEYTEPKEKHCKMYSDWNTQPIRKALQIE